MMPNLWLPYITQCFQTILQFFFLKTNGWWHGEDKNHLHIICYCHDMFLPLSSLTTLNSENWDIWLARKKCVILTCVVSTSQKYHVWISLDCLLVSKLLIKYLSVRYGTHSEYTMICHTRIHLEASGMVPCIVSNRQLYTRDASGG